MTYEVRCQCGNVMRGRRQSRHQVVSCNSCGRGLFVFPRNPVASSDQDQPAPFRARRRLWRWPILIGCAVVLLAGVGVALFLNHLSKPPTQTTKGDAGEIRARMDTAKTYLRQGSFHRAVRLLDEAVAMRDQQVSLLSQETNRELNQLQRQADVLARLLPCSLEDIVKRGKLEREPEEWEAAFAAYRGKSVLLDTPVLRDEENRFVIKQVVEVDEEPVRLAFENVELLTQLPLPMGGGVRMIFALRLESCRREKEGEWVVRFEKDSCVLMTDAGAVEAAFIQPPGDLDEVLTRQRSWLAERPAQPPARERDVR